MLQITGEMPILNYLFI